MLKRLCWFALSVCCFTSCKTVSLGGDSFVKTLDKKSIGSIGVFNNFILEKEFSDYGFPKYDRPVKISASLIPESNTLYSAFMKANIMQGDRLHVKDTLGYSFQFVKITTVDKLELISSLNSEENFEMRQYLSLDSNRSVISDIALAMSKTEVQRLLNAESIFLVETDVKTYSLQVFNKGKKTDEISFKDAVVFAYKPSCFCWKENQRKQLEVVDLINRGDECKGRSYRTARRAKMRNKFYKY